MTRFMDRAEAGRMLGEKLQEYAKEKPLILSLLRGGVPVGYEIAKALHVKLDIWVIRKIGLPWEPEYGIGAIAEGGYVYLATPDVLEVSGISDKEMSEIIAAKRRELEERVVKFRKNKLEPEISGRTVIIVDDGIATGGTVLAAIRSIRNKNPSSIVLAVPVAALSTVRKLTPEVDNFVSLLTPADLYAIGLWYENFEQVEDEEVVALLQRAQGAENAPDVK